MIEALLLSAVLRVCSGNSNADETDAIKSLNEVKNLQIVGDFITVASKNLTGSNKTDCDGFDEYLNGHVIRIKAPFARDKYFNFELTDFIPDAVSEGRKKRRTGLRDILIPLLLMIKHKLAVVLPLFMIVTVIAFKGFWAGMTGMLLSKLVALKVFLQPQEKRDSDHDEDEEDEHDDHNSYEVPHTPEEDHDDEKPVVIYLHSNNHGGKFSRRRKDPPRVRQYHNRKSRHPWTRRQNFEKTQ